ncbi:zinc knuckle (CCHC-type) family protein [Arabidopsis thaliana]|uniref:Zinc knuckle (CCHC-type) family protein n=1 Tax=Arabidopsis thaliana TaxID=3702 RepID=F4JGH6_ARATH|nr:zinc knuckle (CCHC-type) family protein [Arabidopsis thaliana]AEE82534.1 zinc knuckle (CCHC-type) family protein [Arabidopsis thaliana]|eukprot:NP_680606.1 zinc knuckle (CCHC-type) family protein [Arabidopsis thaliana]
MCGVEESCGESKGSNVVMEVISMSEFHIPQPLMEIIVSKVGEDGVDALKNFLLTGREGRVAVCNGKRNGGFLDLNEIKVCMVQPPYQPDRVGRPRYRRCKKIGHMLSTCTE